MRLSIVISAAILAASATGAVSAQTSVDRTFTAAGDDCRDVEWSPEVLSQYPGIGAACQSVERRDGKAYVKFQGTVKEVRNNGEQIRIDFKEGDTLTLSPPANTVLYMDGRKTPFSQLQRGSQLNFYVPEDQLAAQFFAGDTGAESVSVPIVQEQIAAREQPQRAEPAAERQAMTAQELPATGSDLPLLAWSGAMFLLVGAGMTLYRLR